MNVVEQAISIDRQRRAVQFVSRSSASSLLASVAPVQRVLFKLRTLLVLLISCAALGFANTAAASPIPVAVTTCSNCNNQASLQAAATSYFATYWNATPPGYVGFIQPSALVTAQANCPTGSGGVYLGGTTLLVISTSLPLSGTFSVCQVDLARGAHHLVTIPISTATDAGAIAADNLLLARSVKMQAIKLPTDLPFQGTDPIDLIGSWLAGDLVLTNITTGFWHGVLTLNIPAVTQGTFKDKSTGQTFTLWSGDTINVSDSNGWTAKYQWIPSANPPWQLVPGSVHNAQGQQVNMSNNTPVNTGGAAQPIGPINISVPGGTTIILTPWNDPTTPGGSVIVCTLDGECVGGGGGGGGGAQDPTIPD